MMITGVSVNELYCLAQKGYAPGNIVVGNSGRALGVLRGFTSSLQTIAGGELQSVTEMIADGRHAALKRMEEEAARQTAHGLTGVVSDLKKVNTLMEFLAIGSAVKGGDHRGAFFTSACSGQDLYCQMDAGYEPRHFVMGNVAYAMGVGRGFLASLRGIAGGEVKELSQTYNHTRHLARERIEN